jgi:hypothetical protein
LPGHQVSLRDVQLLELGVARELDDLHAVLQGQRDAAQRVGSRDEHHVGEVVVQIEIVIVEVVILLGIEHLEQRRSRIAAKIRAHLVDLVQQEHGIVGAHLLQTLHDLAGQSADVRPAMAADLGLVAHAAQ